MGRNLAALIAVVACSATACGGADESTTGNDEPARSEPQESAPSSAGESAHSGCVGVEVAPQPTVASLERTGRSLTADVQRFGARGGAKLALAMEAGGVETVVRMIADDVSDGRSTVDLARTSELDLPADEVVHLTLHRIEADGTSRPLDTHGVYAFQGEIYTESEWQERSLKALNQELSERGEPAVDIEVTEMGVVDLDAVAASEIDSIEEGEGHE